MGPLIFYEASNQLIKAAKTLSDKIFFEPFIDFIANQGVNKQCSPDTYCRSTCNDEFERIFDRADATLAHDRNILGPGNLINLHDFLKGYWLDGGP